LRQEAKDLLKQS
jgi:tetratricopeptide (TPR) repeat protein